MPATAPVTTLKPADPERAFHRASESYVDQLRETFSVSWVDAYRDIGRLRSIGSTLREALGWIDAFARECQGHTRPPAPRHVAELVIEAIAGSYGCESAIPVILAAFDLGEPAVRPETGARA